MGCRTPAGQASDCRHTSPLRAPPLQAPQQQQQHAAAGAGADPGMDAFMTGFAGNMLRQQGQTYLQRGQAFMQVCMCERGGVVHMW